MMKVSWQGFLGTNHSWAVSGQGICRSLINKGHNVHMCSTNTYKNFPKDLEPYKKETLEHSYDMQLSYTAMSNFSKYLSRGNKNRFGIWCYEFAGKNSLPTGFAKNYKYCDKILPPSNFAKQVFLDSGIPEKSLCMIPHGFDASKFLDNSRPKYPLNLDGKFKILINVAQPHIRKNLDGMLEAYGRAFTNKDDVCLVLKVVEKKITQPFEVNFRELYSNFKSKFKNHAQVRIINEFIDDIDTLYRSCDMLFSLTRSECFGFPFLEAMAAGNIVFSSNWGGQLDFLNDNNSILVSGKEVQAPPQALYWEAKRGTIYFEPNIDEAVEKLRYVYTNHESIKQKLSVNYKDVISEYTWDNVTDKILKLCE